MVCSFQLRPGWAPEPAVLQAAVQLHGVQGQDLRHPAAQLLRWQVQALDARNDARNQRWVAEGKEKLRGERSRNAIQMLGG